VNLHQKNTKLTERAVTIVERALRIGRNQAQIALKAGGDDVPVTIAMHVAGTGRKEAKRALKSAGGNVRRAIETLRGVKDRQHPS